MVFNLLIGEYLFFLFRWYTSQRDDVSKCFHREVDEHPQSGELYVRHQQSEHDGIYLAPLIRPPDQDQRDGGVPGPGIRGR